MDRRHQFNVFLNIVDAVPGSIYWKDVHGKYLGCNKYMLEMTGLTRLDIIGKTDKDLVWKDIAGELQQIDNLVIKNKAKYEVEEIPLIANSQKRTYLSTKTPLYDESSEKIIGIIGVSMDITDRKDAERLQKEKEVHCQVSKALELLSGSIAHEVRTPLSGIGINVDNLYLELEDLLVDCQQEKRKIKITKFIKNIKLSIDRANSVVSMLLIKIRSILGYQTEKTSYFKELKSTAIKSDINSALTEYPFSNNERKLVVWDEKNNTDFKYTGNSIFTKHMIFNLIKNSLKAIKDNDQGKIYIALNSDNDFNYLNIKDTASGISQDILDSLFQPFNTSSKEGVGLGLVFCKMVMQSYDGDITCNTVEGGYTEFTLSFPMLNK